MIAAEVCVPPPPKWDRMLETCVRRGDALVLVPGSPPVVRGWKGLGVMDVPPLSGQDVAALVAELASPAEQIVHRDGHESYSFKYGDDYAFILATFRQIPSNGPPTCAIVMLASRESGAPGAAPSPDARAAQIHGRQHFLIAAANAGMKDVVLVPGRRPLQRSELGLHPAGDSELSSDEIARLIARPDGNEWRSHHGFREGEFRLENGRYFQLAVWGDDSPTCALILPLRYRP